ncbi:predicted protein [Sclerotinia sclerotiorum 1980 UF-70]|uniref:Uncharacterized protein n=1 Tax=Sclerotinia sclerotiorum (strain ATCC 18683 / 1980 / Ss-1) TaxID=665079 RepID=A7EH23_SCLS1|nr:predicted protein [Sclerotinia sclerotiorum 1980 UF-70]EDO02139.1 predicted protein [Sclerotinia sclerotiorum 1980 UF-70]
MRASTSTSYTGILGYTGGPQCVWAANTCVISYSPKVSGEVSGLVVSPYLPRSIG